MNQNETRSQRNAAKHPLETMAAVFQQNRPDIEHALSFETWRRLVHATARAFDMPEREFEITCKQ